MIKDYIGEIITGLVTSTAGLGAWLHERKQRKINEHQSVVDLYQEALDDLKKRYDVKFTDLEVDIKNLKANLNLWKKKYQTLKQEFDEYRANHQLNE